MRYPKLRELREAIKSLFSRPYTIKYPAEPSVPPERFRGKHPNGLKSSGGKRSWISCYRSIIAHVLFGGTLIR